MSRLDVMFNHHNCVRCASDFIRWLLPQGVWARCNSCQGERRGSLGGNEAKRRRCGKEGKEVLAQEVHVVAIFMCAFSLSRMHELCVMS